MKSLILGLTLCLGQLAFAANSTSVITSKSPLGDSCNDITVITAKAAISSNSSRFECSYSDEYQVMRSAEQAAEAKCLREGFTRCRARMSRITEKGYLGYQKDFSKALGWGCIAEAIVHATH